MKLRRQNYNMENNSYKDDADVTVQGLRNDIKEYINLKVDEYKLRGVEGLATLTSKAIFLVLSTMICGVVLQLAGLALALLVSQLVGNMALGFAIVALLFAVVLAVMFAARKRLFVNRLVKMYIGLFFKE